MALNNALDEMDLTDIYRAFHPKETKYTFFSNVHGIFSKVDHMIGHKAQESSGKLKSYQAFSRTQGLKLETNLKEKNPKHSKPFRLNSMQLNMNG